MFDKILHDKYRLDDALLGADDRLVIMIRKPGPTISSITRLFGAKPGHKFSTFAGARRITRAGWPVSSGALSGSRGASCCSRPRTWSSGLQRRSSG